MLMVRDMAASVTQLLQGQAADAERKRKIDETRQDAKRSAKKAGQEGLKIGLKIKTSGLTVRAKLSARHRTCHLALSLARARNPQGRSTVIPRTLYIGIHNGLPL